MHPEPRFASRVAARVTAALTVAALSGCIAFHRGNFQSSVSLAANNFHYVARGVTGKATATYFLVFGGLMTDALVAEAKGELMKAAKVEEKQTLANVSVDFKTSTFGGLVSFVDCVVTADVVAFD